MVATKFGFDFDPETNCSPEECDAATHGTGGEQYV
jgi:hypothetical protein